MFTVWAALGVGWQVAAISIFSKLLLDDSPYMRTQRDSITLYRLVISDNMLSEYNYDMPNMLEA